MTAPVRSDQCDTPKTDAAATRMTCDSGFEYDVVHADFARAQERRIAELEEALALIPKIVNDAYEAWDSDNDSRVGKILRALAGRLPLYREDTSKVVAVIQTVTKS